MEAGHLRQPGTARAQPCYHTRVCPKYFLAHLHFRQGGGGGWGVKGLISGRDVFVSKKEVGIYKNTTCKNQNTNLKHSNMKYTANSVLVN